MDWGKDLPLLALKIRHGLRKVLLQAQYLAFHGALLRAYRAGPGGGLELVHLTRASVTLILRAMVRAGGRRRARVWARTFCMRLALFAFVSWGSKPIEG